jgi:hypothetical protein
MCRVSVRIDRAMSSTPISRPARAPVSGTISHSGSWPIAARSNGPRDLHFTCEHQHDEGSLGTGDLDHAPRYERDWKLNTLWLTRHP